MGNEMMAERPQKPNLMPAILRRAVQVVGFTILLALILFVSAGRIDWLWGWIYMALSVAMLALNAAVLLIRSPELVAERSRTKQTAKSWDKVLTSIMMIPWIGMYVVPGLDVRFGWSAPIPVLAHLIALLITLLGNLLILWAMTANVYFTRDVRIQDKRGHAVTEGGPYRFVRHPGYVGFVVVNMMLPVALGSWWAFIPSGLMTLGYVIRTALEDRTLIAELPGYAEYTQRTRYRLIPGIW